MDTTKRELIHSNIDVLIKTTSYETLKAKCMESGLLFPEMIDKIEMQITPKLKHKALLEKITHRGPTAFKVLLKICLDHFLDAHDILNGDKFTGTSNQNLHVVRSEDGVDTCGIGNEINRVLRLAKFDEYLEPSDFEVVQSDRCYSTDTSACYSMSSRRRGVAFIINIVNFDLKRDKPREGAIVDKRDLINLFQGLGFVVFYYQDITKIEMDKLIDQLITSYELRKTDCLLFAILSHGHVDEGMETVEFRDGSFERTENIYNRFNNVNCDSLIGKPKIFLFPFCRGSRPDTGMEAKRSTESSTPVTAPISRVQSDSSGSQKLPTINDVLLCYATVPGFEALRDIEIGSWYIESMCKIWSQNAHNKELMDLLSYVDRDMRKKQSLEGYIQTSSFSAIGFSKKLFFNPGFNATT